MSKPIKLWGVMKAYPMTAISTPGIKLDFPKDGPEYFIPLFKTREAAVAWDDGSETRIIEVERDED